MALLRIKFAIGKRIFVSTLTGKQLHLCELWTALSTNNAMGVLLCPLNGPGLMPLVYMESSFWLQSLALVGAVVGGFLARKRRFDMEQLNLKLRQINAELRKKMDQVWDGTLLGCKNKQDVVEFGLLHWTTFCSSVPDTHLCCLCLCIS